MTMKLAPQHAQAPEEETPAAVEPQPQPAAPARAPATRDPIAWYDGLSEGERKELRNRIIGATPDDVRADADLRTFFLFHTEDLVADEVPGTRKLSELHHVLMHMRGRDDPEVAETRRKAAQFLLAEYQNVLRDNPFLC